MFQFVWYVRKRLVSAVLPNALHTHTYIDVDNKRVYSIVSIDTYSYVTNHNLHQLGSLQ